MDSFEPRSLAWAMGDLAASYLTPEERTWLCVQIGAGDLERALIFLVGVCARNGVTFPGAVKAPLRSWLSGYAGTEIAEQLQPHVGDEAPPQNSARSTPAPTPFSDRYSHRPRRVEGPSPGTPMQRAGSL
ncbi:hypothetical protein E2F47_25580 [Mycobacterium eburneum]|nr:hypothetical protein [Mycobacterium eburneum]TDH48015.1 hypothetical protein E2F47_25580 [Mycobacterium eburneum]